MLDMKFVRDNLDLIRAMLKNRNNPLSLDDFTELEQKRRAILAETEQLKSQRNSTSKKIGALKKAGEDVTEISAEVRKLGEKISALDNELRGVEKNLRDLLLHIPNIPAADVPIGLDDSQNPEVRRWGTPPTFDFTAKAHWELGTALNIFDFDRAGKVTGARFTFYRGLGARLERACINFMMDLHANKHGYTEMLAPYIVNRDSMIGTGQLPKFAEDM
ncbi:MAG: serine--tRNA ligase, partial [Selenomonadaceae bacterium]|nr:serine--tRNA ligase [Selenomonadaceae bacterium]